MSIEEYLDSLGITNLGEYGEDNAYVIQLMDSKEYGKIFSKLDKADDLDMMEENQVVTEQGSSLLYESESEPYILNLLADFDSDVYQLVVTQVD